VFCKTLESHFAECFKATNELRLFLLYSILKWPYYAILKASSFDLESPTIGLHAGQKDSSLKYALWHHIHNTPFIS